MRALARKLEREEAKHAAQGDDLQRMRERMEKLRAKCPHENIEMRGGVVVCKDCLEEVAYAKKAPPIEGPYSGDKDDDEYER